jgi:hypothetical protein
MTIYEFDQLDKYSQAILVWGGAHIATRVDRENYILLYRLFDFYVEVYFHVDYKEVKSFKSFSHNDGLNPYLDELQLNSFL